jgi:hypothetical protein
MKSMNPRPSETLGSLLLAGLLLMTSVPRAEAATCTVESGQRRLALLELFTSEGCDSCPPADRWVSTLPGRGLDATRVVTLGFHVDYWNSLGWIDPFAKPEYSARQRAASERNHAKVVYTPQLLLNGTDYRRGIFRDDIADRVNAVNQNQPGARIALKLAAEPKGKLSVEGTATVPDAARRDGAQAFVAIYENNLATAVSAGENRGKQLRHDFVVRALAGPFPVNTRGEAAFTQNFALNPAWKSADLHVASLVQNRNTGDVLQALAAPVCR